jgi:hypothetical protein
MLHDLAGINRRMGATDLMRWVLEHNYGAQRTYEALGFEGNRRASVPTGRSTN